MSRFSGFLSMAVGGWLLLASLSVAEARSAVAPFEQKGDFVAVNPIDEILLKVWESAGQPPAHLCSDEVYLRRVYLDLIGTLPTVAEVRAFREDRSADKRSAVVERLFARREFAEFWSLRWCDVLRVKAEFPINLWPNAVQAYHRWIYDAIRTNRPYDQFARDLLTTSGSNYRQPAVNFYRAIQGQDKGTIAQTVALTFMGIRLENRPAGERENLAAFFSRVAFKPTAEWKEEIVMLDPAATGPLQALFPDGGEVVVPAGADPRQVFADWLVRGDNLWFARAAVNRQWFWLFGQGIVHEADDMWAENAPVSLELLDYLAGELVASGFDSRHVLRLIVQSRTYQQSSIPQGDPARATALFACYPVRQIEAEVLVDALMQVFGPGEEYSSAIPEPFTFIPTSQRSIALADGSITSPFLELFGRPARDTGLLSERTVQPTDGQRLHMLNSSHIQNKIERGWGLRELVREASQESGGVVRCLYESLLSRAPTQLEMIAFGTYARQEGVSRSQAVADLAWALVNTKEFLCRH